MQLDSLPISELITLREHLIKDIMSTLRIITPHRFEGKITGYEGHDNHEEYRTKYQLQYERNVALLPKVVESLNRKIDLLNDSN